MSPHITEEEAVSLADGQPVPAATASHAETCESCAQRIADHALLSLAVQLDIRALASAEPSLERAPGKAAAARPSESRPIQLPSSRKPLLIGLAVAIAASVPALPSLARDLAWLSGSRHFSAEALHQTGGALLNVAGGPLSSVAATVVMLALGVLVASRATRLDAALQETEGATK